MKQFTSHLDFKLASKRFSMMLRKTSPFRTGSRALVLLPIVLALSLMFCSEFDQPEYAIMPSIKLHFAPDLSESRGLSRNTQYTPAGEPYTGTVEMRGVKNDSLYSEMYYENGLFTGSTRYEDGEITHEFELGVYQNDYYVKEEYAYGVMIHQEIIPTESEDGLGHIRKWHSNGQLKYEGSYTGNYEYVGLMTLYDEEGTILEQERYEKGERVEKIK